MSERTKSVRGETVTVQGETQERVPKQPHERDESVDTQSPGEPSTRDIGALAHEDLRSGQADTDKGPVLDATYEKVREGASQPDKKFRD